MASTVKTRLLPRSDGARKARDGVIAHELRAVHGLHGGADVAAGIAHSVEQCAANIFTFGVNAGAVLRFGEHHAAAVCDGTGGNGGVIAVNVTVIRLRGPCGAV